MAYLQDSGVADSAIVHGNRSQFRARRRHRDMQDSHGAAIARFRPADVDDGTLPPWQQQPSACHPIEVCAVLRESVRVGSADVSFPTPGQVNPPSGSAPRILGAVSELQTQSTWRSVSGT